MSFTAATTRPALSMKLLIDTKAQRVLFAEVNKDVVDFLFSLLALPVATAVRLLGSDSMVGSVGNLYSSVVKIDGAYVLNEDDIDALLKPTVSSHAAASNTSLLRLPDPSPKGFFRCDRCKSPRYMTDERGTKCLECRTPMMVEIRCVRPDSGGSRQAATVGSARGFVQGIVTYTVTDNLKVTPMSSISSMTLLISHGVMDFSALQEKTVRLGSTAGLAILKASLQSKTVLTDVFLAKKRKTY
ncbi:uncharacterized protein LOC124664088 [Lolium rigidum]|uniref:uncharacterized protein LOC124664088 n=1 Tax=Lolium rigidum TaxID=89674 RepID=UPI001F5DE13B|nr:uncharacterized protein LOC124664088 [Lolium rigidum]